ncbi:MAG: hypothetical protein OXD38_09990 [Aestuariivita sp.]|nr:hypothetical protein [Aestuariivita sp.]
MDLRNDYDFGGQYVVPPDTPKLVNVAVMGNDAKAGTVVWGQRLGELDGSDVILNGGSVTLTFGGLKYNAHYVAVLYSPYLGFTNLRPFARYCFRTGPDPNAVPDATGCFRPYTPTVDGSSQPANWMLCNAARAACNAAADTTWEQAGNRCIAASS